MCRKPDNSLTTDPNNQQTAYTFEEAVELAQFGRYHVILILICGFGMIGMIIETAGMGFITPAAQCDLEITPSSKGILNSMGLFGILSSSHLWGYLGDTRGRRKVLIIPVSINIILNVITSFSPVLWLMSVLRFVSGFFAGSIVAVIFAYLSEFQAVKYRARCIIWGATFVSLTYTLMPCIAWLILPHDWAFYIPILDIIYRPWRLLIIMYSLPNFIFVIGLLFYPESPAFLSEHDKNESLKILKNIYQINTGKDPETYPVKDLIVKKNVEEFPENNEKSSLKKIWNQTIPLFKPPLAIKTLLVCTLQFGAFSTALGLYMSIPNMLSVIAPHEEQNSGSSFCELIEISRISSRNDTFDMTTCVDVIDESLYKHALTLAIPMYITYIIIGLSLNKLGKKNILIALFTLNGLGGILLDFARVQWLRLVFLCLFLFAVITIGLINTFSAQMFPTKYRAMAIAMSFIFGRIGAILSNSIANPLLEWSCSSTFIIFGSELLLCALISFALPGANPTQKKSPVMCQENPPLGVIISIISNSETSKANDEKESEQNSSSVTHL